MTSSAKASVNEDDIVFDANELFEPKPVPIPTRTEIPLRLPHALKAQLTIEAAKRTIKSGSRISMNALIVELLEAAMDELAKIEATESRDYK
jgi:hypothetical protein